MTGVTTRPLEPGEVELVKWMLVEAVSWDPERELPPYEALVEHPELARYHVGWGRPGDAGVVAELDGEPVGVAAYRLFTSDDHGEGFVDEGTPELAIAVAARQRGQGIGERLLRELEQVARREGISRLSLSVDAENPARRLYQRLGYRELSSDDDVLMVLEL